MLEAQIDNSQDRCDSQSHIFFKVGILKKKGYKHVLKEMYSMDI